MNIAKAAYCRVYQSAFRAALPVLPYREPEALASVLDIPKKLKQLGLRSALLVTDPSIRSLGLTKPLEDAMSEQGLGCPVYDGTAANPTVANVEAALALYKAGDCQALIGFGGGSAMDCAKAVGARLAWPGRSVRNLGGNLRIWKKGAPLFAVPTTAGTGSEVTQVSVVSHGSEKRTINNPVFMPKVAIVDPVLSSTVPPRTTMNTGLDALAHALEGYWSKNHQPISDLMAIEAGRTILANLETAYTDGTNMEARANMAYASLLGGLSFALPKTAGCHACSYPLSEDYHLPHGEACAFTLDSFVRINADERLELLCRRVGLSGTEELAEKIAALKQLAGLRSRLSDLGQVDLDKLAHDCAVHGLMANNPVPMDEKALRAMFEKLA